MDGKRNIPFTTKLRKSLLNGQFRLLVIDVYEMKQRTKNGKDEKEIKKIND